MQRLGHQVEKLVVQIGHIVECARTSSQPGGDPKPRPSTLPIVPTLRVRVVDGNGDAVHGATLQSGDVSAETHATGIAEVEIGTFFARATVTHSMPAEAQLIVCIGEDSRGVVERTVVLHPGVQLRGVVRGPDDDGVEGAHVEVWASDDRPRYMISEADGRWMSPALPAGEVEIRARGGDGHAYGEVITGDRDTLHEVVVRVPSVPSRNEDVPSELSEPTEAQPTAPPVALFDLPLVRGRVLRGGVPVTRFAVVRGGWSVCGQADAAVIEDPSGQYELTDRGGVHVLALGTEWTESDGGDIELRPGLRVAGMVVDATGAPVSGARVTIGYPRYPEDPLLDAIEGNFATVTEQNGEFAFDDVYVRAAKYVIAATHSAGASRTHAVSSNVTFVIESTGAIDGIVSPYSEDFGIVSVTRKGDFWFWRQQNLRPSGRFAFDLLVPGTYKVEVLEHPPRRVDAIVREGERTFVRLDR